MKVSVIIPTYNRSKLLLEAADSVLNQTYRDFEIIIVDDGSTDDTENQISRYSDKITYIKQPNAGVNAARNRAISMARGDYIALLDSDDLWFDFKLELQVALLEQYPDVGFVFSDFLIRKESGNEIRSGLRTWHPPQRSWDAIYATKARHSFQGLAASPADAQPEYDVYRGDIYYPSLFEPYVLPSTALIRRRCLDTDLRLVDHDSTCGDWDFFARLSHRYSAIFMDLETTVNRSHEDAVRLTRVPQQLQLARRLNMIERIWKSDRHFYARHHEEVDALEHGLLLTLATQQALNADIHAARNTLRRRRRQNIRDYRIKDIVLTTCIRMPGAAWLLNTILLSKRVFAGLRAIGKVSS